MLTEERGFKADLTIMSDGRGTVPGGDRAARPDSPILAVSPGIRPQPEGNGRGWTTDPPAPRTTGSHPGSMGAAGVRMRDWDLWTGHGHGDDMRGGAPRRVFPVAPAGGGDSLGCRAASRQSPSGEAGLGTAVPSSRAGLGEGGTRYGGRRPRTALGDLGKGIGGCTGTTGRLETGYRASGQRATGTLQRWFEAGMNRTKVKAPAVKRQGTPTWTRRAEPARRVALHAHVDEQTPASGTARYSAGG